MATISEMKSFEKKFRLQADSVEEIAQEFVQITHDLARTLHFRKRKLKAGPLLNAIALWFVRLPPPEQKELARQALGKLEALMDEEEVGPEVGVAVKAIRVDPTSGQAVDPEDKGDVGRELDIRTGKIVRRKGAGRTGKTG